MRGAVTPLGRLEQGQSMRLTLRDMFRWLAWMSSDWSVRYAAYVLLVLAIATVLELQTPERHQGGNVILVNGLMGAVAIATTLSGGLWLSRVRLGAMRSSLLLSTGTVIALCVSKWGLSAATGCSLSFPLLDSLRLALVVQAPVLALTLFAAFVELFWGRGL
jgi:hypothetical protein